MMAADPVFLDTSLLVAASVVQHPGSLAARGYLATLAASQTPTCLSPQVCREFMVVLTRQPVSGRTFSLAEALAALDAWRQACTLLEEEQVHDCNLVAVMLVHGIRRLATRNAADFQRYAGLIDVESVTP